MISFGLVAIEVLVMFVSHHCHLNQALGKLSVHFTYFLSGDLGDFGFLVNLLGRATVICLLPHLLEI